MKPDKIYISKNENVHGRLFDDDVCYIREGALMDWINEVLSKNNTSGQMRLAVRALRSKIESL